MDIVDYSENKKEKVILSDEGSKWFGELSSKPQIEQALFECQNKFYEASNEDDKLKAWTEMFKYTKVYARSLILKRLKFRKFIDPDEIDEKSSQCALNFMAQYIDRPGFHCGASFAGMINPKVLEVLYKKIADDNTKSLNQIINDSTTEIESMQEYFGIENIFSNNSIYDPDFNINAKNLKQIFDQICLELDEIATDEKHKFLVRMYVLLLLQKPKNKHVRSCFKKYIAKDFKSRQIIERSLLELHSRISA